MTTSAAPTRTEAFIDRLDRLVRTGDRGRLAALRRLVASPDRWRPETYAAGIPLLSSTIRPYEEQRWLQVAGLHALWHQGRSLPAAHSGANLGSSMRELGRHLSGGVEPAAAVERRFSVLLAAEDERLVHHLRQAIVQMVSAGVNIDFVRLLEDLGHWDHPDRFVQRRWARSFWAPSADTPKE